MSRHSYVLVVCFIFNSSPNLAESNYDEDDIDEEFLEVLGSFEAKDDEWYDIFWPTIEETIREDAADLENE